MIFLQQPIDPINKFLPIATNINLLLLKLPNLLREFSYLRVILISNGLDTPVTLLVAKTILGKELTLEPAILFQKLVVLLVQQIELVVALLIVLGSSSGACLLLLQRLLLLHQCMVLLADLRKICEHLLH